VFLLEKNKLAGLSYVPGVMYRWNDE